MRTSKRAVDEIVAQRHLAVFGASTSGKKFGNMAAKELRERGYRVSLVHPGADQVDGTPCHRSLADVPEPPGAAVVILPPEQTEKVVRSLAEAGVTRIWIQQGAESEQVLDYCRERGLTVVHGECILMFAEPVRSFHRFHRWLWKLLGKLPS